MLQNITFNCLMNVQMQLMLNDIENISDLIIYHIIKILYSPKASFSIYCLFDLKNICKFLQYQ